jgi:hypothetical protein
MKIPEVDMFAAEALETVVQGPAHIIGAAIDVQ